ncbi:MAG: malate permease [Solirubrobacteraceae bacterium]|nr:malate permease [Solirubrobacteraceae bacterium]
MVWVALTIAVAVAIGVEAERHAGERAGALARRVLKTMLYVLTPFAAFVNIAHLHVTADVRGGVVAGWIALILAAAIGWAMGRLWLKLPAPSLGILINNGLQANTGYLGVPLAAAVLGLDHLSEAVAYDVLVQAPVFLIGAFAVAAATGTEAGETRRQRARAFVARNPPLLASLAGLLAPESLAPGVLVDVARVVVFAMLPLGFFAVGVTLATEAEEGALRFPPPFTKPIAAALGLRLVVAPGLLYLLSLPFIALPPAFLIVAAMPAGLNSITLAHAYGLDVRYAAGTIAWSTAVAIAAGLLLVAVL